MESAVVCLALISQYHQVAIEPEKMLRHYGDENGKVTDVQLLRAARDSGFKSKLKSIGTQLVGLTNNLLPVIARKQNGQYLVIARMAEKEGKGKRYLIYDPSAEIRQSTLDEGQMRELISGDVFFLKKKQSFSLLTESFDIRWFIPAFKRYKKLFVDVFVASLFIQIFALASPLFFQVVMDKVLVHHTLSTLDILAIGFFAIAIFDGVLSGIRNYVFSHTTTRVDVELGAKLYKHLLSLPISYFESRQVGQTVARVHELDSIRSFITGTALTLCIDLLFTFIFFGVMFYYSSTLGFVVLGSIPAYVLLSIFITPTFRARLNEKFQKGAQNQSFLVESISGVETVKACSLEPQMQRRWEERLADYVQSNFKAQNLGNISSQIAGFINKLTTLGIVWFGVHEVMAGVMTVGQLVAFNMIAGRVSGPILKLVQLWQDFQQAQISVKRLGDILNVPTEPGFNLNRTTLPTIKGHIEFRNVKFRYQVGMPLVLDGINLTIQPGECIGIMGRSGSGKSTLTKLLQRFYAPEAGQVLIDGIDISSVESQWLRQHIGVVLQDNFLFNRTIRENIALTSPGAPIEQVIQVAKLAGAHDFILSTKDGYDTVIEEQGANFSGGQKQRLSIARALFSNPQILIFDEATSALDKESEKIIQDNMKEICRGRTVLIIAHKESALNCCDRKITISGKVFGEL